MSGVPQALDRVNVAVFGGYAAGPWIGKLLANFGARVVHVEARDRPDGFAVLSGDDSWTLALMGLGGDGVISVASNEIPATMVELCAAANDGDWATARRIHERHLDLFRINFVGPNPVPVKAALAEMGLISDVLRQPLLPLADAPRAELLEVLASVGLIDRAVPAASA